MKIRLFAFTVCGPTVAVVVWAGVAAAPARGADAVPGLSRQVIARPDLSLKNEVQRAIDRGLAWLTQQQNSNGWWGTPDHPAMTALALSALLGEPSGKYRPNVPPARQGYEFILRCVRPNGSICQTNLANYNTAISMMALVAANDPKYDPILRKARAFLAGTQMDLGEPGQLDTPFDGGVGYGNRYEHSDLNNTLCALEAMYYTRHLAQEARPGEARDLNWKAALQFVQNCQNLPSHNSQPWASDDANNRGGFIYFPGQSMAGSETNAATGRVALRSYGSISYAGLLSYIYAQLKRDDPRVTAVFDWLRRHYTLEENPAMGPQGLYYYLYLMAKALHTYGVDTLEMTDGRRIPWRREVALRMINLQRTDGSWFNDNNRWWEKDPNLVTCYAVMTLELAQRGL